ncbi:blast:Cyclic nucleotide-binding domain-containing protein 2 [Drosophila guanche]|uniref:Blast:Cyclic nucleotide-binding domain-containing protein 2 n=1 Tax=Drosophila guanche TaxID=7266 RepID=A0A3B0KT22_DROGU|nr:blast:Cyclic nucleotide-binding domain-containing protein 2 [Drosophila guanche]
MSQPESGDVSTQKVAKLRFKQLIRNVILNMQWLRDAKDAPTHFSMNVKRNVAMLVRQKRKVGMMTTAEKALFRMPHQMRTVKERMKLCTIVADLACFSKLNPKLRVRLLPHLIFLSLTPGRLIMKQGDYPITMYFILTGEVEMAKRIYDKATQTYETMAEAIFGPGDCIGDIDVMEEADRTHTYIAATNCELLAIYDSDYSTQLQPYMKKMWEEKKEAISALEYFQFFSPEQVVTACKFASIQQFDPLDTIYEEDLGSLSVVYFVLSGECMVLQCLHMKVNYVGKKKTYTLDSVGWNTSSMRKMGLLEIQQACAKMRRRRFPSSVEVVRKVLRKTRYTFFKGPIDDYESYVMGEGYEDSDELQSPVYSSWESSSDESSRTPSSDEAEVESETEGSEIFTASSASESPEPLSGKESGADMGSKPQYETHFIDVASLTFGAIFGLGEKMQHRNIMTRTHVQCLVIPRFWLFEPAQNPGNFWQRKRFFVESNLPTRETLFNDFVKTRNWQNFSNSYLREVLSDSSTCSWTRPEDIPIVARIMETTEDS